MIHHHPDTELLTDYAAGSLAFGKSLCVSVHLESCPHCRVRVRQLDVIGAELLENLAPVAPADDSLQQVLSRINGASVRSITPVIQRPIEVPGVPRPLAKLLPQGLESAPWQRVTSQLDTLVLPVGEDRNQVALIRMKPGGTVGEHRHAGEELTVVLKGGFSDHGGVFKAGDFVRLGCGNPHQPIAHQNEDCICLAVQDGPIQFTGFWSRLMNPFVRIHPA